MGGNERGLREGAGRAREDDDDEERADVPTDEMEKGRDGVKRQIRLTTGAPVALGCDKAANLKFSASTYSR